MDRRPPSPRRILATGLASAAACCALAAPAAAATISVTTAADGFTSDGQCGLREAISASNTDTPVGGCPTGDGVDLIDVGSFDPKITESGVDDTNAAGDLDVLTDVTIAGAGRDAAVIDNDISD